VNSLAQHIGDSAQALKLADDINQLHDYVRKFIPPPVVANQAVLMLAGKWHADDRALALQGLKHILAEDRFNVTRADGTRGALSAILEQHCSQARDFPRLSRMSETFTVQLSVSATETDSGALRLVLSAPMPSWTETLAARVEAYVLATPAAARVGHQKVDQKLRRPAATRDTLAPRGRIVAPGEVLEETPQGDFRDYSGCATEAELADLHLSTASALPRVLPLGRFYRFDQTAGPGPLLYLPGTAVPPSAETGYPVPHELPQAYQGTLIVAPQDSGKTKFVVRWAKAANRAGYSLFLVDVKGNLHEKLLEANLGGKLRHFTTQPGVASDRINFLTGMGHVTDRILAWQVRQLAHAILPSDGLDGGEHQYFLQNRLIWLRSLIHLLKLKEAYLPKRFVDPHTNRKRTAGLADLYEFIADPQSLQNDLKEMLDLEENGRGRYRRDEVFGGARAWINRAALLFSHDEVPGGQRGPQATYQEYVQGLLTPLESFSNGGVLFDKVCDGPDSEDGRLFSLDQLGGDEQVTIVLTAREQELDDAVTVTSMAVKRLQQMLFERMGKRKRPVLMLLDETRRIRSFHPGQFITFAREAMAGCVIVYQSIDQIADGREITEILENVGAQIYLNGAIGKTAQRLIEFLPRRWRPTFSRTFSASLDGGGSSGTWEQRQELVDFFQTGDLFRLPSGPRSALIYLKNHPTGRPFIVELDEDKIEELR
jgi:hypothetical protein